MPILVKEEKKLHAFTLVELIITVVIIGILASVSIVKYGPVSEKARSAEAYSVLARIASAENVYRLEYNVYTSTMNNLDIDAPVSNNFTYEVTSTNLESGYASAKGISGRANNSYGMCLKSGKKNTTPCLVNSTCNPRCP
jgi:prepilin-type N-terminal cleavage/methylation domain-containing protein